MMNNEQNQVKVMLDNLRQEMNNQQKYFDYTIESNQVIIHENAFYLTRWPSYTIPINHLVNWINYRLGNMTKTIH